MFVSLWNVFNNNNITEMEVDGKSRISFIKWAKTHPCLVIGTEKGGLAFYNKKNQKKVPTMGKHAKRIISGDRTKDGLLSTIKLIFQIFIVEEYSFRRRGSYYDSQRLQWRH